MPKGIGEKNSMGKYMIKIIYLKYLIMYFLRIVGEFFGKYQNGYILGNVEDL